MKSTSDEYDVVLIKQLVAIADPSNKALLKEAKAEKEKIIPDLGPRISSFKRRLYSIPIMRVLRSCLAGKTDNLTWTPHKNETVWAINTGKK